MCKDNTVLKWEEFEICGYLYKRKLGRNATTHKCVEDIEEMPKLKLVDLRIIAVLEIAFQIITIGWIYVYILQEFQYGNNVFQTTTNKIILTKCWGSTTENMKLIIQEYAGWRRV